jgi:hypothetical protein
LFLASVNFLLFLVGATQTGRVLSYQASQKNKTVAEAAKDEVRGEEGILERVVEDPKAALKSITQPK